jgi:5'-nucleotidase
MPQTCDQVTGQCTGASTTNTLVCACPGAVMEPAAGQTQCPTATMGCAGQGQCVLRQCRDDVAVFNRQTCLDAPNDTIQAQCLNAVSPCASAGEMCKFLACVDKGLGNYTDNRVQMVGK